MLPKKVLNKIRFSSGTKGSWNVTAGKYKNVYRANWRPTDKGDAIILAISVSESGEGAKLLVEKDIPVANVCYYLDAEEGSDEMLGVEANTNDALRQAMTVLFTAGLCELSDTISYIDKLFIVDEAVSKTKEAENE